MTDMIKQIEKHLDLKTLVLWDIRPNLFSLFARSIANISDLAISLSGIAEIDPLTNVIGNQLYPLTECKQLRRLTLNFSGFGKGSSEERDFLHSILKANINLEYLQLAVLYCKWKFGDMAVA